MQYTLPVAVDLRLCVRFCSECSLNLVVGQVFVGTCSVDFFSDLFTKVPM